MKAQKKPVVIDYFPLEFETGKEQIQAWMDVFGEKFEDHFVYGDTGEGAYIKVKTLEGTSYDTSPKDVIIRGTKGEYYPCKKDIFYQIHDLIPNT